MKKVITIILLAAIALTSAASIVYASNNILGDINEDSRVTVDDARLALRFAVNLDTPNSTRKTKADWDKDGNVTVGDARMILRCAINLEKKQDFDGNILTNRFPDSFYEQFKPLTPDRVDELYKMYEDNGHTDASNIEGLISDWAKRAAANSNASSQEEKPTEAPPETTTYAPDACQRCGLPYGCGKGYCDKALANGVTCSLCGEYMPLGECHHCTVVWVNDKGPGIPGQ